MRVVFKHYGLCVLTLFSLSIVVNAQGQEIGTLGEIEQLPPNNSLQAPADTTLLNDVDDEILPSAPAEPAGRWIGVGVAPIPEVLKSHLNLADGLGVMVDQVIPDSPAARAGLRRHDVLIAAGGVAVSDTQSLINAVRAVQDGSLELRWIRGGKEMTAEVIPAERPRTLQLGPGPAVPVDPNDIGRLRDWLGRLEQGRRGHPGRMRFRFMPRGNLQSDQSIFENNLQVQIERRDNEPAKIKVQKDGDTWELTEEDLGQLPEDIRGQVESMLGGGGLNLGLGGIDGALRAPQGLNGLPELQELLEGMGGFRDFESQMDEMNKQMERLFDEMRQLRTEQRKIIPADQLDEGDEA